MWGVVREIKSYFDVWILHLVDGLYYSGKYGTLRKGQIGDGGMESVFMFYKMGVSFIDVAQPQSSACHIVGTYQKFVT